MSRLHTDFVRVKTTQDGQLIVEPEVIDFWRTQGYTIESVEELAFPESSSRDACHMVVQVTTYALPKDHPRLDFVEHQVKIPVCSCEGFRYRYSADVSDPDTHPTDCDTCPHIRDVYRTEKAKADESQSTLVDTT